MCQTKVNSSTVFQIGFLYCLVYSTVYNKLARSHTIIPAMTFGCDPKCAKCGKHVPYRIELVSGN